MLALVIKLDGDGMLEGTPKEEIVHVTGPITIGALTGGMQSGAPSVAIAIRLPDGRVVLAETSMKLFFGAARAFRAKFGDLGV